MCVSARFDSRNNSTLHTENHLALGSALSQSLSAPCLPHHTIFLAIKLPQRSVPPLQARKMTPLCAHIFVVQSPGLCFNIIWTYFWLAQSVNLLFDTALDASFPFCSDGFVRTNTLIFLFQSPDGFVHVQLSDFSLAVSGRTNTSNDILDFPFSVSGRILRHCGGHLWLVCFQQSSSSGICPASILVRLSGGRDSV